MHFHRQGAGKLPLECKKSRTVGCGCLTQDGAHRRPPGGRFITQNPPTRDELKRVEANGGDQDGEAADQRDQRRWMLLRSRRPARQSRTSHREVDAGDEKREKPVQRSARCHSACPVLLWSRSEVNRSGSSDAWDSTE